MNKYVLYLAVFAVVCALLARDCDAKAALKKRALRSQKIDMNKVKDAIKSSADARKKRALETPADKIRQKRSKALVSNAGIAEKVKHAIPEIQQINKKLGGARKKRATVKGLRERMINKLKRTNKGVRKTRSVNKAPGFAKKQFTKINQMAKNLRRFKKN